MTISWTLLIITVTLVMFDTNIGGALGNKDGLHPIIEFKEQCLIGGVQNLKWIDADRFARTLKPNQKLKRYTLAGPAEELRIDKVSSGDCPEEWLIEGAAQTNEGVAIGSPTWEVMPRHPRPIDTKDTTYLNVIGDILKRAGMKKPDVKISEGYKIDLDGDGKEEVVIVASRFLRGVSELSGVSHGSSPGDYALVLVRKIVDDKVQNIFIIKDIRLNENEGPLSRGYHISAIADLNGDGTMEIALHSAYHEGSATDIIEIKGTKWLSVLQCACEH
jgi:hypothetical protein